MKLGISKVGSQVTTLGLTVLLSVGFLSCQSKVSEKSPGGPGSNLSAEQTIKARKDQEEKMAALSKALARVRRQLEGIRSILKNEEGTENSFIENLTKAVGRAQDTIFSTRKDGTISRGTFIWKTPFLKGDCQTFNYLLAAPEKNLSNMIYSLGSCYTQRKLLSVADIKIEKKYVHIQYNNENLRKVLPPEDLVPSVKGCRYHREDEEETLECQQLAVGHSKGLNFVADILAKQHAEIKLYGYSIKTGRLVYTAQATITKDLKVIDFKDEFLGQESQPKTEANKNSELSTL